MLFKYIMVLEHNVDLTNELVFARVTLEQAEIKEETAHITHLFDGMYGVDQLNVLRPINITVDRFIDLFYRKLNQGCCDFMLAEKSPELVVKPGGYQKGASVLKANGQKATVDATNGLTDSSGNSGEAGHWSNISLASAQQVYAACANAVTANDRLGAVVAAGGRGWVAHYDASFSVLETVTNNLEVDLGLDRKCFDACTFLQVQAEVTDTLDIAQYFKDCKPAKECVMSSDELATVLNEGGNSMTSKRSALKPVVAGDKLAVDVEYSNSNPNTNSTVFRLHMLIKDESDNANFSGYDKAVSGLYDVPMLR